MTTNPASQPSDLVRVPCGTCGTLMYARVDYVGRKMRCPDCHAVTVIPAPPAAPAPFVMPDTSDIRLDAEPAVEVDVTRKELADRLMAKANESLREKDAEKPPAILAPFKTPIYRFAFYPRVAALWIITTLGLLVVLTLVGMIAEIMRSGGFSQMLAVFLVPITSVIALGLLGLLAPHYVNIIEHTSDGHDQIPHWPSHDILARGHALLLWVNALAVSTAPGVMLVELLRAAGLPLPRWLGLLSTALLFPAVTMSMLVNDSVFAPYSRVVHRSFSRHASSWKRFYWHEMALALALIGLVALSMTASNRGSGGQTGWNVLLAAAVAIGATIYCRLIGHLGWIFGQDPNLDGSLEEEDDSGIEPIDSAGTPPPPSVRSAVRPPR